MDELGFNKIAGAVLATALGFMFIREVPHLMMHSNAPETPIYQVGPIVQEDSADAIEVPFPSPVFIASMDATRGAKVFKKCQSCHNTDKGGADGTGPALWNVVGRKSGSKTGFKYSSAMASAGYNWDYEQLDGFLTKPAKYLSGTKMAFIGLKKEADRAAVIEYLRIASDTPLVKPVAAEAAPVDTMEAEMMEAEIMEDKSLELKDLELKEMKTESLEGVTEDSMSIKIEAPKIETPKIKAPAKADGGH